MNIKRQKDLPAFLDRLAMWFFFVSVAAHFSSVANHRMSFAMTWYSFVFPNTALTTATFAVATALDDNHTFGIVGCILAVGVIMTWFFVFSMMVRAVYLRQVLWPQMQEDRDEGGWGDDRKRRANEIVGVVQTRTGSFLNKLKVGSPTGTPDACSPIPERFNLQLTRDMGDEEQGSCRILSINAEQVARERKT
jgi:hypothetical protein